MTVVRHAVAALALGLVLVVGTLCDEQNDGPPPGIVAP